MTTIEDFYNRLAPTYDLMTGFENRFAVEKEFFDSTVSRYQIKSALDAGSGTGFHSLLLAKLGVETVAADLSESMLAIAAQHARTLGLPLRTLQVDLAELPKHALAPRDAVFCMGNTLAHFPNDTQLRQVLHGFAGILRPGGVCVIQLLNYARILAKRPGIVSRKTVDDSTFIRYYSYTADAIIFKILMCRRERDNTIRTLNSIVLHPIFAEQLSGMLHDEGFSVSVYGSIDLSLYDRLESKDLLIIAEQR
jgi:glycine/sarcosine N-methyltransferase